jgi:hypothetical protein
LAADTLRYPFGGGHRWAYLNWALGLRAAGCDVVWLEAIAPDTSDEEVAHGEAALRADLEPYGLASSVALFDERDGGRSSRWPDPIGVDIDLLLTLSYGAPPRLLEAARRTAMIDIDPGLTQLWIRAGDVEVPAHDFYFSIGEAARSGGLPDCGIEWHYTPPCVDLAAWPAADADATARYTTVSHWWPEDDWIELDGHWIENSKRAGFEPLIELPARTEAPLELALGGLESAEEADRLTSLGWHVRDAWTLTATTEAYAAYVRASRGEFSCAKPSVGKLEPGWISDRTLCYLASGKPVVVQHSGELELPFGEQGLLRFRTPDEAARALARVEADYELHSRAARELAESRFDARKVATELLEKVLA